MKDKWESWLSDESSLQPLLDEVPAYFKDGFWDRFSATVCFGFFLSLNRLDRLMVWMTLSLLFVCFFLGHDPFP